MTSTTAKQRMNASDRRASILAVALPLFAERGLSAVTTKELAAAAGISEALLFRHFPTKESLFEAVQDQCFQAPIHLVQAVAAMQPGTRSLCALIHILFTACRHVPEDHNLRLTQLMLRSLLSDGEFAKLFLDKHLAPKARFAEECVKAAAAVGDLQGPLSGSVNLWFPHHVSIMMKLFSFPAQGVVDYQMDDDDLIHQGVIFCLRGLGLTAVAINENYTDELIAEFDRYWEMDHAI